MGVIKVTQDKFDLVKTLLNAGVKKNQIQEISGFSGCTVKNIEEAENLEHYQLIVREQFRKKDAYDRARAERLSGQVSLADLVPKVQEATKKSYTVTMVINVDEEHEPLIAPLTALINNMFTPNDVAVEVNGDD